MPRRLATETYRDWLIDLVRPHHVILITARPDRWKEPTLARIDDVTGWQPDEAYFAPPGWRNPPTIKKHFLKEVILPQQGREARYLAIESNPRSRQMYASLGIRCLWVDGGGDSLRGRCGHVGDLE